ncbi:Calcium-binding protein [Actinidia chinensis var. chinensis]|uniref:Calcium-binding protein n=1 Tax=Actinidia chinensis var. chinensis TaxID=1590841 RepID=A0A2R6Q4H6_ACTCC|nr:Calcium-binding protein [Actinidia chinensis var. chinensis]
MAGYPHNPPHYGYGPPPSQPYASAPGQQPYAAAPGQQPYDAAPYGGGAPSAPYGAQSEKPHKEKPYGAAPPASAGPPSQPYAAAPGQQPYDAAPYCGGAPSAPYGAQSEKPHKEKPYGAAPPASAAPYAAPYGGGAPSAPYGVQSEKPHKEKPYGAAPPASAVPYASGGYPPQAAPAPYGIPFASLVPSAFPPGTDPNVVSCFQMADQDGSGLIDDKELQRALSSYNQSFSLRTVHLLMYLFTNTNIRKIGPKEFIAVFYSLQSWRGIFERFDRDRSSKIDSGELREALMSLGFSVSPTVLELLVSKFDKTGGKSRAIEYDNFIECCLTVKGLTEKFKEKDTAYTGSASFTYESFMLTVLPFLIA